MAKKHKWNGEVVGAEDRFSPSRDSLDSGFSSFPASPNSNHHVAASTSTPAEALDDSPPPLLKCDFYDDGDENDAGNATDEDDQEPSCKMPRLIPIDEEQYEEEDEEIENIPIIEKQVVEEEAPMASPSSFSSSLLLSVPEKEEEEPRPESASIPVATFLKPAAKRVRISTPAETKVRDENEDPYANCFRPQHPCLWADCADEFFDVNDLYDHTLERHFTSLQPSAQSDRSSTEDNNGASGRMSSTQRRALRTFSSTLRNDDKSEALSQEKYRCQWRDCEMSLKRGSAEKKFDWLQNHFRARHAPKAQPLKCLMKGCPIRFQNEKALHAHLLNSHDDRPAKKVQQPAPKQVSCYDYLIPVRTEAYATFDFFDQYTFGLVGEKVKQFYTTLNEQLGDEDVEPSIELDEQATPCMLKNKTLTVLRKVFPTKMGRRRRRYI